MNRLEPIRAEKNIPIVFSTNTYFLPYMGVMIQSIMDHASPQYHYDMIVLHSEIKAGHIAQLEEMAHRFDNCTIRCFDVAEMCKDYSFFVGIADDRLSNETYYRLMIGDILSERYEKAIYLDGDMVTLTDVAQLYDIDLSGFYLAAAPDICGIAAACKPSGSWNADYRKKVLKLSDPYSYFIGGLLVFNLNELRRDFSGKKLLELASGYEWKQHDQDVLNVICNNGKAKLLHASWNVLQNYGDNHLLPKHLLEQWHESEKSPLIVHYGGSGKPWEWTAPRQEYFWSTAAKTEYFGAIVQRMTTRWTQNGRPYQPYTEDEIERVRQGIVNGEILPRRSRILTGLEGFRELPYSELTYKPLISVIVPVYKAEQYLSFALDSLLNQTYQNLEIILVDDGSPDNCGKICDEYAARDSRIKVIHKENGGVATARNAGLAAATGEWIGWMDSDDWLDPDMFEYMAAYIQDEQTDVVVCGRVDEYENGWQNFKQVVYSDIALDAEQALKLLLEDNNMRAYLWDKLWRRELFDGIEIPELRVLEDFSCMHHLFARARKLVCVPEEKYHYRQRENSLVNEWTVWKQCMLVCAEGKRLSYVLENQPRLAEPMAYKCLWGLQYLWKECRKANRKQLKECKPVMGELVDFAKGYYSSALDYVDIGRLGRMQIWLTRFPHRWSFVLYALLEKLHQIIH